MKCRFCETPIKDVFIDLINAPASNSYLTVEQLNEPEVYYPLKTFICDKCFLVQLDEYKKSDEIFNENYAYFSSFSTSWLEHAKNYVDMIVKRLQLSKDSFVTEIASNDGYLIKNFKKYNIPCVGIEPTKSTAKVAKEMGINVIEEFFSNKLAQNLEPSDLIIGNNVIAHVPNIVDFIKGLKICLKPNGTITLEFPHILKLIQENQFDTIYHEHFSYLSLYTINKIFKKCELKIYDVKELPTHGGSLRIYATHKENNNITEKLNVAKIINNEVEFGLTKIETYKSFQEKIIEIKYDLIQTLLKIKKDKKTIIAYGAAAKGNTLLNYFGIRNDLIPYVVDKSPYKQNLYLPGSHIQICDEKIIKELKPDYIFILPWNLEKEIIEQLSYTKQWNCNFLTAIPNVKII